MEFDVTGELFALQSWGFGYTGNILQLVRNSAKD
jgi:hypothetical protein